MTGRLRYLSIVPILPLLLASCAPPPEAEELKKTSSDVDVLVKAPLYADPTAVSVNFAWFPPTKWENFTHGLDNFLKPFKFVGSVVSTVTGFVNAIEVVGQFLGIFDAPPDQFAQLQTSIENLGTSLSWQINGHDVDGQMQSLKDALGQIQLDAVTHTQFMASDSNSFWSGAVHAMNVLEETDPVTGLSPFMRSDSPNAIQDDTSHWTDIINGMAGITRPAVTNNSVYDWRLHIPALLQAIPERLLILAATDQNFRTNHEYDSYLYGDRKHLLQNYQTMYSGLICGGKDRYSARSFTGDSSSIPDGCRVACADMYMS